MTHVLQHEILYKSETILIHKTYDQKLDRYGMLREYRGRYMYADTTYRHIFPFQDERAAAITDSNEFVWVDTDFCETPMDFLDKVLIECQPVKSSVCNCVTAGLPFGCELCSDGRIFNSYNWKIAERKQGQTAYYYDTEENMYVIYLTEHDNITFMEADYTWQEAEVEMRIRDIIDTCERQQQDLKEESHIYLLRPAKGKEKVRLTPCTIMMVDINRLRSEMADAK